MTLPDAFELDTLAGLIAALQSCPQVMYDWHGPSHRLGRIYCPTCGDLRRVEARVVHCPDELRGAAVEGGGRAIVPERVTPCLLSLSCVECDTVFTALIYQGSNGPDLAVLPNCRGGLRTPHTPPGVAYYLDQAGRSKAVGANTAAMSMFRGALDHLLYEQGYTKGMVGQKLAALDAAISAKSAPRWALDLDVEYLDVLRELGNGSLHTHDGDVSKQEVLDNETLGRVQSTFLHLLFLVYEVPFKHQADLAHLRAVANRLKK